MNEIQQFLTPFAYSALFFVVVSLAWNAVFGLLSWFLAMLWGR